LFLACKLLRNEQHDRQKNQAHIFHGDAFFMPRCGDNWDLSSNYQVVDLHKQRLIFERVLKR